jgi:hypothetical protein
MAAEPAILRKQFEAMLSQRNLYERQWQLLADYVLPRKNDIESIKTPGEKRTQRIFDSSGPHDAELLGASLGGALMPPMLKWFSLVMRNEQLGQDKAVRDYLEDVRNIVLKALSQSNFSSEIQEVLLDLGVFGTGGMIAEVGPPGYLGAFGGLRFRAMHAREYVIAEDPFGMVDDVRRRFDMTASQILRRWFENDATNPKIPEDVAVALKNDKRDGVQVLHSVYPRRSSYGQRLHAPQQALRLLLSDVPEGRHAGRRRLRGESVPRRALVSSAISGYGPAHTYRTSARSTARSSSISPPPARRRSHVLVDDDNVLNQLTLEPAGVVVRRPDSKVEVLESKARFDVAEHLNERLERKIAEVFFLDALRLRFKPNMTATEVMALQDEMLRLLGPTAGRLHSELLGPVIERTIGILNRANVLPPLPDVLAQEGGDVDIQYEGPLARASKSADLQAIDRVQAMRERIAQSMGSPAVYDSFDITAEIQHYALNGGYPAGILRDAKVVAQIQQARTEEQQQQAQMNQMEQVAGAAQQGAGAVKLLSQRVPARPGRRRHDAGDFRVVGH